MNERIAEAPEELQAALMQSFTVKRYGAYEDGIFYDSTGHHTLRCVDIVDTLPEGDYNKAEVRLRVLSHDLPEIVTSDYTAIQKEDEELSRNLEILERKAAKEILPPKYQKMLDEFNLAGEILKGKGVVNPPPSEAFIAKVIDIVENDIYFHRQLRNWINSSEYDQSKLPGIKALSYTFRHSPIQLISVSESDYPDEIKNLCLSLLKNRLKVVQEVWSGVSEDLVPKTIRKGLVKVDHPLESENRD